MSKIKFAKEISLLIKNIKKIPDDFWMPTSGQKYEVIWFINRQKPSVESSYDFDEERLGITKDGQIIYGFDSGCSCPSPWSQGDYGDETYDVKTYKEFLLGIPTPANTDNWFDENWEDEAYNNLQDYLLVIKKDISPEEVLQAKNAEVRRYLMKRVGYENVRKIATVLHTDGTSELIDIQGDHYVKVKDASTDREYLLYVPPHLKTCKSAIAWSFGLQAKDYNPIKET